MKPDDLYKHCQQVYRFDIVPPKATAQAVNRNPHTGKPFFKREAAEAKATLVNVIGAQSPSRPMTGAIELHVMAVWPLLEGDSSTKEKQRLLALSGWLIRSMSKPDNDNFLKFLQDILKTCGYIRDDADISDTHIYKRRGEKPCLIIGLSQVEPYFIDALNAPKNGQAALI